MIIDKANQQSKILHDSWFELMDTNYDTQYERYMDLLYKWNMAKYETQYAVRDINWIRSIYSFLGTLW